MENLFRRIRAAIVQTLQEEPDLDQEKVKKVAEFMRLIDDFETQLIKTKKAA